MNRRTVAQGVAGAAALIAVLTLLARVAGFGRTLVFTNTVGADSTGDTYQAANTVPNIVFEVVAGGALASLVVPMLAGGIAAGNREQVRRTASALLGWALLVLTPLAVAIAVFAEPIARLLLGARRRGRGGARRALPAGLRAAGRALRHRHRARPACCRRTAGSPARPSPRCCPASSSPAPT